MRWQRSKHHPRTPRQRSTYTERGAASLQALTRSGRPRSAYFRSPRREPGSARREPGSARPTDCCRADSAPSTENHLISKTYFQAAARDTTTRPQKWTASAPTAIRSQDAHPRSRTSCTPSWLVAKLRTRSTTAPQQATAAVRGRAPNHCPVLHRGLRLRRDGGDVADRRAPWRVHDSEAPAPPREHTQPMDNHDGDAQPVCAAAPRHLRRGQHHPAAVARGIERRHPSHSESH